MNTIEVNGQRWYETPDGLLPSVTTVLGYFETAKWQQWRDFVGDKKADKIVKTSQLKGNEYHDAVERYLRGEKVDHRTLWPDVAQLFRRARPTLDKITDIQGLETVLWSKKLGIAGRCDLVGGMYEGRLSIIDHKTSRSIKKESDILHYFEQATAYSVMNFHMTGLLIPQIVIIMIPDGSGPAIVFKKEAKDYISGLKVKIRKFYEDVHPPGSSILSS